MNENLKKEHEHQWYYDSEKDFTGVEREKRYCMICRKSEFLENPGVAYLT